LHRSKLIGYDIATLTLIDSQLWLFDEAMKVALDNRRFDLLRRTQISIGDQALGALCSRRQVRDRDEAVQGVQREAFHQILHDLAEQQAAFQIAATRSRR